METIAFNKDGFFKKEVTKSEKPRHIVLERNRIVIYAETNHLKGEKNYPVLINHKEKTLAVNEVTFIKINMVNNETIITGVTEDEIRNTGYFDHIYDIDNETGEIKCQTLQLRW